MNDASTNGDVYCTVAGSEAYSGLSESSPRLSITNLLASYVVVPGDVVYVDAGTYTDYAVVFTNRGSTAGFIHFRGSTNTSGRTIIRANSASVAAFTLAYTTNVVVSDFTVENSQRGIYIDYSLNTRIENVLAKGMLAGFQCARSSTTRFFRCVAASNTYGVYALSSSAVEWDGGVLWSNSSHGFFIEGSSLTISNSVVQGQTAFSQGLPAGLDSVVFWGTTLPSGYSFLSDLELSSTNYQRLVWADPQFALAASNDFHLKSVMGRFDMLAGTWVTDAVHSALIDLGNPARAYTNEPDPRGTAINVGRYGNTEEASLSQTNPWLFAATFNDGGAFTGTGSLWWAGGGFTNGSTVRIQYSTNAGVEWATLAGGIPTTNRTYSLISTGLDSSLSAKWRVQDEEKTNVNDACDSVFTLRRFSTNGLVAYVNDASTMGDQYCTVAGSTNNTGLTADQPRLTLQSLLNGYDFGPGDVIYVDAGVHTNTAQIGAADSGGATASLLILGSTNENSVISAGLSAPGIRLSSANYISISNLVFLRNQTGIDVVTSVGSSFGNSLFSRNSTGISFNPGTSNTADRLAFERNTLGYRVVSGSALTLDRSVFYFNTNHVDMGSSVTALSVSNTLFQGGVKAFSGTGSPNRSNYLLFWNVLFGGAFNNLYEYQRGITNSWQSTFADPLFVAPDSTNFSLRSMGGTYDRVTATFYTDTVHSAGVDFGDPARSVGEETAPNGGRMNAGNYAGTYRAARSLTNAQLRVLSLQDGGQLSVGDTVHWQSLSFPALGTVRIEYSGDGGFSWGVAASNLLASAGSYTWTSTNFTSSTLSLWRVVSESDPALLSATATNFTLRNGVFKYYLNDTSTNADQYCSAVGSDANAGTTPASPKLTLTNLLAVADLEPGDVLYIDTGVYRSAGVPTWGSEDSGQATNPVLVQCSTNWLAGSPMFGTGWVAGGSILDRQGGTSGLIFSNASHVLVRGLVVTGAQVGVSIRNSSGIRLEQCAMRALTDSGVSVLNSLSTTLYRVAAYLNTVNGVRVESSTNVSIQQSILWRNGDAGLRVLSGWATISNSVVASASSRAPLYRVATLTNLFGNFNNLWLESNAVVAVVGSPAEQYDSAGLWQERSGQDRRSLGVDPLFANPSSGDFHLKTQATDGRYDPALGTLVNDGETSLLIDSADPALAFSSEPSPNGSRADIGLFGSTVEASKSLSTPWIHAASFAQGGVAKGTSALAWVAGNFTNGTTVRLDYSRDGGHSWVTITNDVLASNELALWDTTLVANSPAGLWRVTSLSDTNVTSATTNFFSLRNAPLSLYLNDSSPTGDVYTTALGASTNWEASADRPFNSLASALRLYDLEPGDTVYVDSGTYSESANTVVSRADSGYTGLVVRLQGSTNVAAGSMIHRGSSSAGSFGLQVTDARWVAVSNLTFQGGYIGVGVTNSSDLFLSMRASSNASDGISIGSSTNVILRRAVSSANQGRGYSFANSTNLLLEHSVAWSNVGSAVYLSASQIRATNNVLTAHSTSRYIYEGVSTNDRVFADFNDLLISAPAQAALLGGRTYRFLAALQMEYGADVRSLSHAPDFADAATGDFHLKSRVGRWSPGSGWVTDAVHSVLIDAGSPNYSRGNEPEPTGDRVNLGVQGGTAQASLSDTNGFLLALTLNDGGTVRGTNDLYWLAVGPVTGHLVYLDFSGDGGLTWTNLATNVAGNAGSITWNTTAHPSTLSGVWRITSQTDTALTARTTAAFTLNNGSLTYYVNDTNTNGDVYCTAVGHAANDGASASTPLSSLASVLSRYTLGPGDQVLVDTGVYGTSGGLALDSVLQGVGTNRIVIQGSTNEAAGGTVLDGVNGSNGVRLISSSGVTLRGLRVRNARTAVLLSGTTNCVIEQVVVEGARGLSGEIPNPVHGVVVAGGHSLVFRNCAVIGVTNALAFGAALKVSTHSNLVWEGGVMWSNGVAIEASGSQINVTNSTFSSFGSTSLVYSLSANSSIRANFNNYHLVDGAQMGRGGTYLGGGTVLLAPLYYQHLSAWTRSTSNDQHSLSHDPLFANPAALDFHVMSQGGRWAPGTGVVYDAATSPLVDAGDPASAFTNEAPPHGDRRNIGMYGDTGQASQTPTNARVLTVSFNQGGVASGMNELLYWVQTGAATGHLKQVDLSLDDGYSWLSMVSNLAAGVTSYTWNTTTYFSQPGVRWRVASQDDPSVQDGTDGSFMIRNSNLVYYVNDAATTGDVYCTNVGNEINTGRTPGSPKALLSEILDAYDLEPGDTVYVDTGMYALPGRFVFHQHDAGEGTNQVQVLGSTNEVAGGTQWVGTGALTLESPRALLLQDVSLQITGTAQTVGVLLNTSSNVTLRRIRVRGNGLTSGIEVRSSFGSMLDRCVVVGVNGSGLNDNASRGTLWQHGVLWSNVVAVKSQAGSTNLSLRHSVLGAFSSSQTVYVVANGLQADYNSVWSTNGALVASQTVSGRLLPVQYETVADWARATGSDLHSLALNPKVFAAPTNFHLVSSTGRYDPEIAGFVNDAVDSPLIDAGDPAAEYGLESDSNGGRVNIGLYGNTTEASRSSTQALLQAVSLNDGGSVSGTNQLLYWVARGAATGYAVRIEYSADDGATWNGVVTNLPPATSAYVWNSTGYLSSVLGRWRVVAESDTNVTDASDAVFALRNGPVYFYVNDGSTSGDVYCSSTGLATNNGVSVASPVLSLADIFSRYDLVAGDVVYVDTGVYTNTATIQMTQLDSGMRSSNAFVTLQGSTNVAAGGSVLCGLGVTPVLKFYDVEAVSIRDLSVKADAGIAVGVDQCTGLRFERVQTSGGTIGFDLATSSDLKWKESIARNHSSYGLYSRTTTGSDWNQGAFWSNGVFAVYLATSSAGFSNTIFGALTEGAGAYLIDTYSTLVSEYNSFHLTNGAFLGQQDINGSALPFSVQWQNVSRWSRGTGKDIFSLAHDPLFVDAVNSRFQLQSVGGRYDPYNASFTNDDQTSPLLDAGSPVSAFSSEPLPHGDRVNIGPHGNTYLASQTPTQSTIHVVSLNDGGRAEGAAWPLYWLARGAATAHTVRLEFAGGTDDVWSVIASNLPARRTTPYYWNSLTKTSTPLALWRVVSELDSSLAATSAVRFALRNQGLSFYVNDSSAVGDVYTTAVGLPQHTGADAAQPRDDIQQLLHDYDLEPGDCVYVDTGIYEFNGTNLTWGRFDAWDHTNDLTTLAAGVPSIVVQGSTNEAAGGTQFRGYQTARIVYGDRALGVSFRDLLISQLSVGSGNGLEWYRSHYASALRVRIRDAYRGFHINDSDHVYLSGCFSVGNAFAGLSSVNSAATEWQSGVLWSNLYGVEQNDQGTDELRVENTLIGAFGAARYGYYARSGRLVSDYNHFQLANEAMPAIVALSSTIGAGTGRYEAVSSWVTASGLDKHSQVGEAHVASTADFHPQSPVGRFVVGSGYSTNLADEISPLLDAGNPASTFSSEPWPNGNRINIGMFGNSTQASLSPTNSRLTVVSLDDGGNAWGTIALNWNAGGDATGHMVRIEYSDNGGLSWSVLASNLTAAAGTYDWNSLPYGSSPGGLWRVISEDDATVSDQSSVLFSLRNGGGLSYYVNDGSTYGDVYCNALGNDSNEGILPTAPKATLQSLVDSRDLEPGDTVYVDTGTYLLTAAILLGDLDAGQSTNRVVFQGSTNLPAGGTVINRQTTSGNAIHLQRTAGLEFRNMKVINAGQGFYSEEASDCYFVDMQVESCSGAAYAAFKTPTNYYIRCLARSSGSGLSPNSSLMVWRNGVVWGNAKSVDVQSGGSVIIHNSVLNAVGSNARIYTLASSAGTVAGNHNLYVREGDALFYQKASIAGGNDLYPRLADWQQASGEDLQSMAMDPLFANATSGDFHPRSAAGRYLDSGAFTNDDAGVFSPLIDAGDSTDLLWTNEPSPNGGRINIGMYGGTPVASLSNTNPWLMALSYNDGGTVSGLVSVSWVAGGLTNGARVRLEQALNGVDYALIASNVLASAGTYPWDVSYIPVSPLTRWRVVSEDDPSLWDANDQAVLIKNQRVVVYINDDIQDGDVYTTAPGAATNSGQSVDSPLRDPDDALTRFTLGPDDVVYVDTGTYALTNFYGLAVGLVGSEQELGVTNVPIRIIGSTNFDAGGSRLIPAPEADSFGIWINNTRFVDVENFTIQGGGGDGVGVVRSTDVNLRRISAVEHAKRGFYVASFSSAYADRCAAWGNTNYGFEVAGFAVAHFDRGVLWSNQAGAAYANNATWVSSNSVLGTFITNTYLVRLSGESGWASGDYNMYHLDEGARIGYIGLQQVILSTLISWQRSLGCDAHSALMDPLFHAPETGDFHLRSVAGRYDPGASAFVEIDTETSWAIDAGSPGASYTNEPMPNGGRMNVGLYGDVDEASMSVTSIVQRELCAVTLNDGGQVTTNLYLRWYARGFGVGDLVNIEFSADNGVSWSPLATNLAATAGEYLWVPYATNSTPVGYWRISSVDEPATVASNAVNFAVRLIPVNYYINDTSTVGDIYSTEIGSITNNGLSPSAPAESLQAVFDLYDIESGDHVYLDTGTYLLNDTQRMLANDSGGTSNPVYIIGSTNWMAGGTILDRQSTNMGSATIADVALDFQSVSNVVASNLIIQHANTGIGGNRPNLVGIQDVLIRDGGAAGISMSLGSSVVFTRVVVTRMTGVGSTFSSMSPILDSCIIWSNAGSALVVGAGVAYVSNSVLHAASTNFCYDLSNSRLYGDYNDLYFTESAYPARFAESEKPTLILEGLPQWTVFSTQDLYSVAVDPLFAHPDADDFHPQSSFGRFDPTLGGFVATDTNVSWLVDGGPPSYPYADEPEPNGGRRNVGVYGNSSEASMGYTGEWVRALTASSGGRVGGTFFLTWLWGNLAASNTVALDYSFDGGTNWVRIASNQVLSTSRYLWDSTASGLAISPIARWRLLVEANTNVADETDHPFALNGPFSFFVNDSATVGDVFTTAVGDDGNLGIYSNAPMATLANVLDSWDLEGGDAIYVDTGVYAISTNQAVNLLSSDGGESGSPVHIRGSTNGVLLNWAESSSGATLLNLVASHVQVRNLGFNSGNLQANGSAIGIYAVTITGGTVRVGGSDNTVSNLTAIQSTVQTLGTNLSLTRVAVQSGVFNLGGRYVNLLNSLAWGTSTQLMTVTGSGITLSNNTLISVGTVVALEGADASLKLRNNIMVAEGAGRFIVRRDSGALDSDYNNLLARNGAWFGRANGLWERLLYWQNASGQDAHSISVEPLLANEATGDFHPKSVSGRYTPSGVVTDAVHSPMIDLGDPATGFASELDPNGSRVNLGAFGGTTEASRSLTNSWLMALTMNDSGVLKGTNTLRWTAGGLTGGETVTLRYSSDGGATWSNIAVSLAASLGEYVWDSTQFPSSLNARWGVVLDADTNIFDDVDVSFALRNTPLPFYVNDLSTADDVYTAAPGHHTNDGLQVYSPQSSIMGILDAYDTEGGDVIYVDTGLYALSSDINVIWSRGGDPTNGPLWIWGSTNYAAGGTRISRGSSVLEDDAIELNASHVTLRNLTLMGGYRGVLAASNRNIVIERSLMVSNVVGITTRSTTNVVIRNNRFWNNTTGGVEVLNSFSNVVENNTFVGNKPWSISIQNTLPSVLQNNIFEINTTNDTAYSGVLDSVFVDYNIYHFTAPGYVYGTYSNLLTWQLNTRHDYRSVSTNPLMASASAGDFHLQSTVGRWVDGAGWTTDSEDSWGIDKGSTNLSYSLEPEPNGGRINMGAYGNTEYASLGRTSSSYLVEVRMLNEPTSISETNAAWPLIWTAINVPTSETFRVEFSPDNGLSWYTLSNNVPAYQEFIVWNTSPFFNTYRGRWRVVGINNTNYWDINDDTFNLFYGDFEISEVAQDTETNRIVWRGAWAENYRVQYSTNVLSPDPDKWHDAVNGIAFDEQAVFLSTNGGNFTYKDTESTTNRFRLYRVILDQY